MKAEDAAPPSPAPPAEAADAALGFEPDPPIRSRDVPIGCIAAGFIMADVQLAAYARAGFRVAAIASRTQARAAAAAQRWQIPRVHATPAALIADPALAILDIAVPPDRQPALIRAALAQPHIRGILAQKPLAMETAEAARLAAEAATAGKLLSVNQNMRYDQSMRVLRQVMACGALGSPVLATIEMRAMPHWQDFLRGYDRLTIPNMGIRHFDILRFLLGEPAAISVVARTDPRTDFAHRDGIVASVLRFPSGAMAVTLEDVWSGPRAPDFASDIYIKWRVEGTDGVAQGTIGWPDYPHGSPSTLRYASRTHTGGQGVEPRWTTRWFPDAFSGPMEQLQHAVATGAPLALPASVNAHCGAPELAVYSATKGALATLTRNAANALSPDRIRVNGINLGWTATADEHVVQEKTSPHGGAWLEAAQRTRPFGPLIRVDEAADLAAFLLSHHAGVMTGSVIDYDQLVIGAP